MATLNKTSVRRAVSKAEAKIATALVKRRRDIDLMFSGFLSRAENLIRRARRGEGDMIALREAIEIADQMAALAEEAGLRSLVENFLDEFEPLTDEALRYFKSFKGFKTEDPLGGVDETHLDAWVRFSERRLRRSVDQQLLAPIQESFLQAAFGALPRQQIVETIIQRGTTLRPDQVVVAVDSSFRDYQREVTVLKAQELLGDDPIYLYTGPLDDITSEQCEFMLTYSPHGVPGMLYQSEITVDLHPKLRDNPLIHGGHPRCRHKWMPVTEEFATEQGFVADG